MSGKKKAAKPQPPHRLSVDIPHEKGEKLNRLLAAIGVKKASFIRLALYEKLNEVAQEKGVV